MQQARPLYRPPTGESGRASEVDPVDTACFKLLDLEDSRGPVPLGVRLCLRTSLLFSLFLFVLLLSPHGAEIVCGFET